MDDEGLPDEEVLNPLSSPCRKWHCFLFYLSLVHSSDDSLFMSAHVLQKVMRRSQHARKETEFLRLKRTRLGLDDFESLKVIGRGAFGEVRQKTKRTRLNPSKV